MGFSRQEYCSKLPFPRSEWVKSLRRVRLFASPCTAVGRSLPWNFPGKSTGVGCHFLLQGIFPTQGLNLDLRLVRRHFTDWATREPALLRAASVRGVTAFATSEEKLWPPGQQASGSVERDQRIVANTGPGKTRRFVGNLRGRSRRGKEPARVPRWELAAKEGRGPAPLDRARAIAPGLRLHRRTWGSSQMPGKQQQPRVWNGPN